MSDTKAIALASTLALGPPRSWIDGCAAWVDSRDEQCGKPRSEGYLCARHHKVATRHLEKKKQAAEKRKQQRQERLEKHGDKWRAQLARVEAELDRHTDTALAPQLDEEALRLRDEIGRIKQHCLDGEPRRSLKYHP